MYYLILISTLFVIGSCAGFVIELLFRRIFTQKRWVNPGFLIGPYIPIYGFGVLILYGLSAIPFTSFVHSQAGGIILSIVIIGVSLTLIELITGLIFIRGLHIKLWDYSNRWGNFKGVICPLFSFLWFVGGIIYFFLINPYLVQAVSWISNNVIYSYFIGIVIGMMLVDMAYCIHLGFKIKHLSKGVVIRYEQFKQELKNTPENSTKNKFFGTIVSLKAINKTLPEAIKKHVENFPRPSKWWKKKKKKEEENKEEP